MTDNFKNNIIEIFKNYSFYEKYNNDIWITIIAIIFSTFLSFYFFLKGYIKSKKAVWDSNKCNPLFMGFGETINEDNENYDSEENFNECLNELNFSMGNEFKSPLDALFKFFMYIFNIASVIVSQIFHFFLYLLQLILSLFKMIIDMVQKLLITVSYFYSNVKMVIYSVMNFFDILKYMFYYIFDIIRYNVILFFSHIFGFLILFVLSSFAASVVLLAVTTIIFFILFSIFPPLAVGLIPILTLINIVVIILFIVLIFLIVINVNIRKELQSLFCDETKFFYIGDDPYCNDYQKETNSTG